MTSGDFRKIYWLRRNIVRWERRLEELDLSSGIKSSSEFNAAPAYGTNATSDNVGKIAERRMEICAEILKLKHAAEEKAKEIYQYIAQISLDDPYMAAVIEERCINCRRWEEVADVLGGNSGAHKMAYARYMQRNFPDE